MLGHGWVESIHFLLPENAYWKVGTRIEKRLSFLGGALVGWGRAGCQVREGVRAARDVGKSAAESSGPNPPKAAASSPFSC